MNRILKQSGFHHMGLLERLYRRLYRDPNERDPDEIDYCDGGRRHGKRYLLR